MVMSSIPGHRGYIAASTVMGDHLHRATRPTQPPALSGMENEYQPNSGDAMWPENKGRMIYVIPR